MSAIKSIAAILLVSLAAINCRVDKQERAIFRPMAQLGYQHNICVMHIVDELGEDYVIQYKLYIKLFSKDGYNSVIEYYYSNPNDNKIQPIDGFYPSNAKDANYEKDEFFKSYSELKLELKLWHPNIKVRMKAMQVRRQLYGQQYQPSNAKPTIQ